MSTRFAPVLSLFVLTPLVAEYLLGSLPMSMIAILPLMAALYGSAALLIREIARRIGGGWGSADMVAPVMASPGQLIGAALAAVAAIAAAFAWPRHRPDTFERPAPAAWLLFVVAFLAGSGVMASRYFGPAWHMPWPLCVAVMLAI